MRNRRATVVFLFLDGNNVRGDFMHIPDGFLNSGVSIATGVIAAGTIGFAMVRARDELDEKAVPLLALCTAFVFAAQMLNFPVAGGTSGHFLGAVLAVVLLGPWLGSLVIGLVLLVQCLGFADGGDFRPRRQCPKHGRYRRHPGLWYFPRL